MLLTTEDAQNLGSRRGRAPPPTPASLLPGQRRSSWNRSRFCCRGRDPLRPTGPAGTERRPELCPPPPRSPLPSSGEAASRRPDTPGETRDCYKAPDGTGEPSPAWDRRNPRGRGEGRARSCGPGASSLPARCRPDPEPPLAAPRAGPPGPRTAGPGRGRGGDEGGRGTAPRPDRAPPAAGAAALTIAADAAILDPRVGADVSGSGARLAAGALSPWRRRAGAGPDGTGRRELPAAGAGPGRTQPCCRTGRDGGCRHLRSPAGLRPRSEPVGRGGGRGGRRPAPPSLLRAAAFAQGAGTTPRAPCSVRAVRRRGWQARNGPARSGPSGPFPPHHVPMGLQPRAVHVPAQPGWGR